ncbi:MAG: prepilin-type N-terminal cleavage/methylation domain-containing protein [Alphaproteobacteria bacterium]
MNSKKITKAFSLIELSIVILIIGILVAGVTGSSRLVSQMRLVSARSITKSSPITSISGLSLWYETTDENSITSAVNGNSPSNNDRISFWNDLNPQQITKINIGQTNDALRPIYTSNSPINGLPSLLFNNNEYFELIASGSGQLPLRAGDDTYTFITVWRSLYAGYSQTVVEQNSNTVNLISGARAAMLLYSDSNWGFNGEGNDGARFPITYNSSRVAVLTNNNGAINIYDNKLTTPTLSTSVDNNLANVSEAGLFVGVKGNSARSERFYGYISEIVIFDRVLNIEEINEISRYLSRKYNIKLS